MIITSVGQNYLPAHFCVIGIENPKLPERKVLPVTKPEPFRLNIEERVETRVNKWQEEIAKVIYIV
jgi:hypothetical protein